MSSRPRVARIFTAVAALEAVSWCFLLFAMYRKHGPADDPTWVSVAGPIHGALFIAYVLTIAWLASAHRWKFSALAVGLVCGIPPLFSVVFERWAAATGLLDQPPPLDLSPPTTEA